MDIDGERVGGGGLGGSVSGPTAACVFEGCSKRPTYGIEASRKRQCCAEHAHAGMVNIDLTRCATDHCDTRATFGDPVTGRRQYCSKHAPRGASNIERKKCSVEECPKPPAYWHPGNRKRRFCVDHAEDGMVKLDKKLCPFKGCFTSASYGTVGEKRKFCAAHAQRGMVSIGGRRCAREECTKRANYGVAGTNKRQFCAGHAAKGMVNINNQSGGRRSSPHARGRGSAQEIRPRPSPQAPQLPSGTGPASAMSPSGRDSDGGFVAGGWDGAARLAGIRPDLGGGGGGGGGGLNGVHHFRLDVGGDRSVASSSSSSSSSGGGSGDGSSSGSGISGGNGGGGGGCIAAGCTDTPRIALPGPRGLRACSRHAILAFGPAPKQDAWRTEATERAEQYRREHRQRQRRQGFDPEEDERAQLRHKAHQQEQARRQQQRAREWLAELERRDLDERERPREARLPQFYARSLLDLTPTEGRSSLPSASGPGPDGSPGGAAAAAAAAGSREVGAELANGGPVEVEEPETSEDVPYFFREGEKSRETRATATSAPAAAAAAAERTEEIVSDRAVRDGPKPQQREKQQQQLQQEGEEETKRRGKRTSIAPDAGSAGDSDAAQGDSRPENGTWAKEGRLRGGGAGAKRGQRSCGLKPSRLVLPWASSKDGPPLLLTATGWRKWDWQPIVMHLPA